MLGAHKVRMIEVKNLIKTFKDGQVETKVLKGIDLKIQSGEFISIMGRSGAGKSTLLYQMSLLDDPTEGKIIIDEKDSEFMPPDQKTKFRLENCGYVFQDYALLPDLNAIENVALPLLMQKIEKKEAYKKANQALLKVKIAEPLHDNLPGQLSGGEQQRVSIARAIAHHPKILFADEPTANLDNESSRVVMEIFKELHKEGQTIIMVTHEEEYSKATEKTIKIDDGKIVSIEKN